MKPVAVAGCLETGTAFGAVAERSIFGTLPDGRAVAAVTLANGHGITARVIALGATLQSLVMPDRTGARADVQIGYDTLDGYVARPDYFGATVGRVANRIAGGHFTFDGKAHATPVNDGPNSLHGGTRGFDKVLWEVVAITSGPQASVTLRHVSPDGDMGYPGTLTTTATYALDEQNQLTIEYRATTDAPTLVNISNHAYWNLAGAGAAHGAMEHVLTIAADRYTPTDATAIPTGRLAPVAGTAFDFRTPRTVGDRVRDAWDQQIAFGRGYDHNWVIGTAVTVRPHLMATVTDPLSGRGFELWSNQPGLQFYSANFFDGTVAGKGGRLYRMGDAIVLEPQLFPDAPNQPDFPSARLEPGQVYRNIIVYKLTTDHVRR